MASKQNNFTLLYNLSGLGLAVVLVGYAVSAFLEDKTEPPCSRRYQSARQFALETPDGAGLTAVALQAHAGARERHVLENVTVVDAGNGPARHALEVTLARAGAYKDTPSIQGGAGLAWSPAGIGEAQSACLVYSVEIPADFPFEHAGVLPGIYGGAELAPHELPNNRVGFASRLIWREEGLSGGLANVPVYEGGLAFDTGGFTFPRGRRTMIEQEIVLNKSGEPNGIFRIWIDGRLRTESNQVLWRTDDTIRLSGVIADIGYDGRPPVLNVGQRVALRFSPFELSWR